MSRQLQASVIIPTYNRTAYLVKCLDAVAAQTADPAIFEVIIVDNNSTDNTQDVCSRFIRAHPTLHVRYLRETKQGASYARNRGVAEACGGIVCFLDDDSPPVSEWLVRLLAVFDDPGVGCAGGPSLLDFQGQNIPPWLCGDLQGLLSGYSLPYARPTPVSRWEELPLSCNMAIRRIMFTNLGFFRVRSGSLGQSSACSWRYRNG